MLKLINLRKDLIDEELKHDRNKGFDFHYHKFSNKFIDWLFRHYYITEVCENFYDDEPDYDDEEFNMYMDYCENPDLTGTTFYNIIINSPEIETQKENFRYSKFPHIAFILSFKINMPFIIMFLFNLITHAIIDDLKANRHAINLIHDQILHIVQIILTWWFVIPYV